MSVDAASKGGRLGWYVRRLASMSPPEIAHRVIERGKQAQDARRRWTWEQFDFPGSIAPLPGFEPARAGACLTPEVERHARAVLAGEIAFLSARWPHQRGAWWRGEIWTLDPASGLHWPGRGAPASKSAYRHAHGFGDVKFVWELNRLQFLLVLAAAARRDDDADLAARVLDVLDGWMEANPPFEGINWTNGIEAATRTAVLLAVNALIGERASAALQTRLRQCLGAHVWMLARYPSLFSSANNHRVAEVAALYLAYVCAPALPGARAGRGEARMALAQEVARQFHADGVGAEQSPTYAAYSLEWFLIAAMAAAAANEPFSGAYRERLGAASLALRWMMDAGGRTPAIGDDDEGRVLALGPETGFLYPAAVCASAARWLGDGASAPPAQAPTLLDAFGGGAAASPAPPSGRRVFEDGGYSIWRQNEALLVFDHGPLGFLSIAAHGHADALAVWLHVRDTPLIVDAGTFLYHTDNGARDRFRGTAAHNTLCLAGQNQSRIAGPFNWSEHARTKLMDNGDELCAAHDGYAAAFGVRHVRGVRCDGTRIVINDALEGTLKTVAEWSIGFLLHPDVTARAREDGFDLAAPGGVRARVRGAALTLEDADLSPGFGRVTKSTRLVARGRAEEHAGPLLTTTIELG